MGQEDADGHQTEADRGVPPPAEPGPGAADALELADRDGIESLSMRKLGRELGVEAMSLYNHIADKDDLLDGLTDIVVGEIEVPSIGDDWKAALRRRAVSAREMLTRHPWAGGLMLSRASTPTRSRYPEAVVGSLRQAGFSVEMAVHAFFTLDSYIYRTEAVALALRNGWIRVARRA